jgi:prevent-host-death family protein
VTWQVQTAKQRFSELVERAVSEGPQVVTKHGRETVVVLEIGEYRRLLGVPMDFKEFVMSGPGFSLLDLERDASPPRDVDL